MTRCVVLSAALIGSALAATPFDGVYRGTYMWAGNGNVHCANGDMTIRVVDGKFSFGSAKVSDERVIATVGPDGSFSAQSGQRYLQGKIQGDQLSAVLSAPRCNYNWSLKK